MRKTLLAFGLMAMASTAMAQVPSGTPETNLTAYYNFNSNSDDQWSNNDLTWGGIASYTADRWGNPDGAVAFNLGNFLQDSDFPFPNGDFTVSLWFWSQVNNSAQFATLVEIDESIFMRFNANQNLNGSAGFFRPDNGDFAILGIPGFSNPPSSWTHLALVNDASTASIWVYVNGEQYGQVQIYAGGAASNSPGMGLTVGTGTSAGAENPIKRWNGYIDDLYIYNRGLSAQEVENIYAQANDGGTPPAPPCSLGNVLLTSGQQVCPATLVNIIEAGTAQVPAGGDIRFVRTPIQLEGEELGFSLQGQWESEPYELLFQSSVTPGTYSLALTVRDENGTACSTTETVQFQVLNAEDPACDGQAICDVGNVLISDGAQLCIGVPVDIVEQGSSTIPPGGGFRYRFTGGSNWTGTSGDPWTFTVDPSRAPGIYNLEMTVTLSFDQNYATCDVVNVLQVEVLAADDPACALPPAPCTAGTFAIADGLQLCPEGWAYALEFGTFNAGPNGSLTYQLVPLEGQTATGEIPTTEELDLYNTMVSGITLEGLYELQVMAYREGETEACDMISTTVEFLAETDAACACELAELLIAEEQVICPGETVQLVALGSSIPTGNNVYVYVYDANFALLALEEFYSEPYTLTHNFTYNGAATIYITVFPDPGMPGGDAVPSERGVSGCSEHSVMVFIGSSTDAECLGVGINDIAGAAISIQPNPTSGLVQLNGISQGAVVDVTDMTGRLLGTHSMDTDNGTIDLTHLPSGLYLLRTAGGVFKVVKD